MMTTFTETELVLLVLALLLVGAAAGQLARDYFDNGRDG